MEAGAYPGLGIHPWNWPQDGVHSTKELRYEIGYRLDVFKTTGSF